MKIFQAKAGVYLDEKTGEKLTIGPIPAEYVAQVQQRQASMSACQQADSNMQSKLKESQRSQKRHILQKNTEALEKDNFEAEFQIFEYLDNIK